MLRALLESFLMFDFIYIQPNTDKEKEFRVDNWIFEDYVQSQKIPAVLEASNKKKTKNLQYISEYQQKIEGSIYFGMNFEVYKSLTSSEQALNNRDIKHQVNKNSIYVRDSILCNENVFTALYEVRDKEKRDSLRNTLFNNVKNKPGIEYIKEIFIGYKEEVNFLKWKEFLYPLEFGKNDVCQINDSLQIHFTRGNINEVKGITFKVKFLAEAKQYLVKNKLFTTASDKKIKLSQTQSFGLSIYFTDEE